MAYKTKKRNVRRGTRRRQKSQRKTMRTKRKKMSEFRRQRAGGFTITEETNPESYDDDYEKNLANMEEVVFTS